MGLATITVIFSIISSLVVLSQASHVLDDFSSAVVTVQDPPEDTDWKAIAVPLEKPSSSHESIPAVEGLHDVVDLSLHRPIDHHFLRPIDHHFLRPIDRQFLPGETPHSSGSIRFPRRLRGEMRWIPTRTTPEVDDVSGNLEKALAQDLTEVQSEEAKVWIPVEWKAKEEEHERKKKKRDHKKKKERDSDSDSDSDSDDDEEEIKKKKKKSAKHEESEREEGGLLKRFWAFLNSF